MAMVLMKSRLRVGLSFVFVFSMLWTLGSAWAQGIPALQVSGFRGSYSNDQGSAFAEKWNLPQRTPANQVNFAVYKEESQFRFTDNSSEYIWEDAPEFLLELEEMNWDQAAAKSGTRTLEATVSQFFGRHPQHTLTLKGLSLSCQGTSKSILHEAIGSCLNKGHLGFDLLETKSQTSFQFGLYSLLPQELIGLRPSPMAQSELKLENLEFKINRGSFNLSVRAHLDIRLNLKAGGKIKFQAGTTPTSGELELRIDKVKAGFLTVTGKVFDELEKINDPNIRVARPFVYISFP